MSLRKGEKTGRNQQRNNTTLLKRSHSYPEKEESAELLNETTQGPSEDDSSIESNSGAEKRRYSRNGRRHSNSSGNNKKDKKNNLSEERKRRRTSERNNKMVAVSPLHLATFKPAMGCTDASDYLVRCFVARLRAGITVTKHGRSRYSKSRLRILHIHSDGCSLSWKPAEGEPMTNRRPPKLDLCKCLEVRHASTPDPRNSMYTATSVLRHKCDATEASKSFALIFPKRTVDITATTEDQCKVLMEGFSALCYRLHIVAAGEKEEGKKTKKKNMWGTDGV